MVKGRKVAVTKNRLPHNGILKTLLKNKESWSEARIIPETFTESVSD